jgi:hypothetical protein
VLGDQDAAVFRDGLFGQEVQPNGQHIARMHGLLPAQRVLAQARQHWPILRFVPQHP